MSFLNALKRVAGLNKDIVEQAVDEQSALVADLSSTASFPVKITLEVLSGDFLPRFIQFLQYVRAASLVGHGFMLEADREGGALPEFMKDFGLKGSYPTCYIDGDGTDKLGKIYVDDEDVSDFQIDDRDNGAEDSVGHKYMSCNGLRDSRWDIIYDQATIAQDRAPDIGSVYDPRSGLAYLRLAFDFQSVRHKDIDGRLHISVAHISKATVNPYYGWEIPNNQELGLNPEKRYYLLRDPKELEKAVPTFNNIQLIDKHKPVSSDEPGAHLPNLTIGSTGTDAAYHHPFLDNSLVLWDREAINDVEQDRRRELSCAYRYKPDMTPGVYEGQHYDGVMREIAANHLCLVREGRAGSDVIIGDSKMIELWRSPHFTVAMAQDKALDCSVPVKKISRDAGTSEGAVKAAATRKSHGGNTSDIQTIAKQHGYTNKEVANGQTYYQHQNGHSIQTTGAGQKNEKWHHFKPGSYGSPSGRVASGSSSQALHEHLSKYHKK